MPSTVHHPHYHPPLPPAPTDQNILFRLKEVKKSHCFLFCCLASASNLLPRPRPRLASKIFASASPRPCLEFSASASASSSTFLPRVHHCRDVLLMQKVLPVIRHMSGNFFVFQQDSAPAHRVRDTVALLRRETAELSGPER